MNLSITDRELGDALSAARQALLSLNRRIVVVTLEGPPDISRVANRYALDAMDYFQAMTGLVASLPIDEDPAHTLRQVIGSRMNQQEESLNRSQGEFVRSAREALGGHL
ncbi:NAD(P)H-hydrate epimerase [Streptomyces sp. 2R]|uniref:NAD(P)H-hydrate epimerase n=1 Tax=Streptomyces sp. 2R TaxID=1883452 RepID=UPI001C52B54A|nr:NAD(P)H-hydrate epimerase [Streptomyces sp. 2R]